MRGGGQPEQGRQHVPRAQRLSGSRPENSTVNRAHSEVIRLASAGGARLQGGEIERVVAEQAVDAERERGAGRRTELRAAAQGGRGDQDNAADREDDGRGLERRDGALEGREAGKRRPQQDGAGAEQRCGCRRCHRAVPAGCRLPATLP